MNKKKRLIKETFKRSRKSIKERKQSKMSSGELRIAEFLKDNGVRFIREYYMKTLYNSQSKRLLFFDFFLPDYNAVIEFDGQQHFKPIYGAEKLRCTRHNDSIKNWFCQRQGIKILRIPYYNGSLIEKIICEWFDKHF